MMRLPKFAYLVPKTVGEAVRMMGEAGPSGQFVAGGTDLYPNMKRRQQTPRVSSRSVAFRSCRASRATGARV